MVFISPYIIKPAISGGHTLGGAARLTSPQPLIYEGYLRLFDQMMEAAVRYSELQQEKSSLGTHFSICFCGRRGFCWPVMQQEKAS